ncbi:MAG TPA: universal stress protein [Methylomirabilota bacterium]|nr:universal stress protein [Methylomirabilota bacterium]
MTDGEIRGAWRFLHPTDFSEASELAFAHALKLTLLTRGELRMLHVSPDAGPVGWNSFPGVREALERWGVLPPGSSPSAVAALGVDIVKVQATGSDPVGHTADFLREHPADVIVMATHPRDGLARWRQPSVASAIGQHAGEVALFVPEGATSFVSPRDGSLNLRRILVPVDHAPSAQPAIDAAVSLATLVGDDPVIFRLLHVGETAFPSVTTPARGSWSWERQTEPGEAIERLTATLHEWHPQLIVMTTAGRHGFMDAVRGSTTERVLRTARCPLLAVSISARALPRLRGLAR